MEKDQQKILERDGEAKKVSRKTKKKIKKRPF